MNLFYNEVVSEKKLVEQIKEDKEYFSQLYGKYLNKTYNFVYYKVQNKELAEDLISESWFKILKNIDSFTPEKDYQVSIWIFRIVRNHMFDYFKKKKNIILENSEEILNYIEDDKINISRNIGNEFSREILFEQMNKLSKQEKEILNLKYFSDLKNNEISKILNIKEKSVSSVLCKGIQKLTVLLKDKVLI
ncbi:MAG: sigma-70 family RNA polymerase sigma factor [Candidatus Gracilibacteria bacterium]|nr:sigma-70 family RNA polymerase sigma factor [Candidatus Gracilibacteria bacterium]MDQ7023622.1 sigma-70 family RNA polymerase sigma factor [Candidatus Gracilibacteria bacterium]